MPLFPNNERRERLAFIAILVGIGLVVGAFLYIAWRHKVEDHYANEQAIMAVSYRATLQTFSLLINSYYYNLLSSDRVLTLLNEAYNGSEEKRDLTRGMIYRFLWPYYQQMQHEQIQQLHFHTPDGRSFLRFQDPILYNDQLNSYRPLIRLCGQKRQPMVGFEIDRTRPGFHFVFPLHDHEQRNLGSVGMNVTMGSFLKAMNTLDNVHEYAMVVRRDMVVNSLLPSHMWIFDKSVLSDNYLAENDQAALADSVAPLSPQAANINQLLATRQDVKNILAGGLEATISARFQGAFHVIAFFPIKDIEGRQIAYLISYAKDPWIVQYGREFALIWLETMLGAFVIVALFTRLRVRTVALDIERRHLMAVNEALVEGVYLQDKTGVILGCNSATERILGFSKEEMIGQDAHHLFHRQRHGDSMPKEECNLHRHFAVGEGYDGYEYFRAKDGRLLLVEVSSRPIVGANNLTETVCAFHDITARQAMEDALRDGEALQRTLLESLPVGVAIIDEESRMIELANPYALKLFGSPATEIIGHPYLRFCSCDCPEFIPGKIAIIDGRPCKHFGGQNCRNPNPIDDFGEGIDNNDRDLIRADGARVPLVTTSRLITIGDKKKLLECFLDISERKRGEEALREAVRQLQAAFTRAEQLTKEAEAANQAKSNFLASMSHEIRTPMNAVLGMTHLALRTELTAQQRDYLDKVDRSARSLLELLNEILDLSKVEAGKLELEKIPFSLHEVLETTTTVIAARIGAKDIELAVGIDHDVPPWLSGDPLRLRQILINLAGNAAKFTEEGEIVVRARLVSQNRDKTGIEFIIRDTGVGMDDEQQKLVFQPFTQANASTTRTFGGTGLGLSISQRLVELMGGRLTVKSAPDKGSTFRFTAEFGTCAEFPDQEPVSGTMQGLKVLIVDDRESARSMLGEYLLILGVTHKAVDSAEAAIAALKESSDSPDAAYNLVLVDWRMPDMDGLQLVRAIFADPLIQPPPLVTLVSAFGREDVRQQAMTAGCVDFLTKPISLQRLRELLERIAIHGGGAGFSDQPLRHLKKDDSIHFAGGLLLLAEDNLLNQQVANGVLVNAGFQVIVAQNGVQAVRMAQERQFDGVLMDIQMPEMDGYTATEKIRQLPGYKKIPIIAMTAYASNEAIAKMRQAGMDEHIAKPIDLRRLFSVLGRWFTVTDQAPAKVGALDAACPHQEPGAGVGAQGQMLDKDELAARLRSLIPVLRDSRPKACAQAFAALDTDRWPKSPRGEIERIRRKVDEYNFAEAISLTETLLQGLQGEHNA